MDFTVEFDADHLHRALEAAREALAIHDPLLGAIGESLLTKNRDRHAQGLAPDGTPWKPLAQSTLAEGNRKGGPLNKTSRMLANFHYQVKGDALHLGFGGGDGFKAKFHQDGSRPHVITAKKAKALKFGGIFRKRVNHPGLPARPLVGFPAEDARAVVEEVEDYLLRALHRARGA